MMHTTFTLLRKRCGLSQREAAALLRVRIDTVKSWGSGRNNVPQSVVQELRELYAQQVRAADKMLGLLAGPELRGVENIVLGIASDDSEAQELGWPCVGVHGAVLGMVAARANVPVTVVPRGADTATAAACDAHGK